MATTPTGSAERFGLLLLGFLFSVAVCGQIQLLCHLRLGVVPPIVAAVVCLLIARKLSTTPLLDVLGMLTGVAAIGLICSRIYDLSWDGQTYHQEAVFQIAHGWNPIWDAPLPIWHGDMAWCNYYPKGIWVAQAALYRLSGNIESAKLLGPVLLVAAFLLSFSACQSLSLKRGMSVLVAGLAAANPVALAQLSTFYVDGLLASLLTILTAVAVLYVRRPAPRYLLAMIAAMALLCVTKFTGVVYAVFYAGGIVLFALYRRRSQLSALLLTQAMGMLAGVVLLGFQPYLTNLVAHLHPFHPLAGSHKVDFLPDQLGPKFGAQPRLLALTESIFSVSTNDREWPRWKVPFAVTKKELGEFAIPDIRIGGFGPWFGGIVLLTTISLVVLFVQQRRTPKLPSSRRQKPAPGRESLATGIFLTMVILASCLVNPGVWWARYVPQMWLIPVVMVGLLRLHDSRWVWPLSVALILNVALVQSGAIQGLIELQRITRAELEMLRFQKVDVKWHTFAGARFRLQRSGVDFREAPLTCSHPITLIRTNVEICPRQVESGRP